MNHNKLIYSLGSALFISALVVLVYTLLMDISTESKSESGMAAVNAIHTKKDTLFFGVVSRYSPNIIYRHYQPVMDYLNRETMWHFEIKLSDSYEQTIRQVASGEVSLAFVGSLIYVNSRERFPIEPIVKQLNRDGHPNTHSVLIANKKRRIKSLADLDNAKIALPSRQSFSGYWFLNHHLSRLDLQDIDSLHFFDYHHTVVYQVLKGNFDAGAVKEAVAQEFIGENLEIIGQSPSFPVAPVIIKKGFNAQVVNALSAALISDTFASYIKNQSAAETSEFKFGFSRALAADYDDMAQFIKNIGDKQ